MLLRMATIPQKELRNNVAAVLRRAEAGEELTITVSGRPVARLGRCAVASGCPVLGWPTCGGRRRIEPWSETWRRWGAS